ncbi:FAD-dependent oxidoreductase [Streptomyces sp. NPDC051561]|uniref:FAD-dependent oxidoreductase n=1 Tax=Streptomyces sp. NPDC051561 TaxID=3365658 RepID=UPI0037AD5E62
MADDFRDNGGAGGDVIVAGGGIAGLTTVLALRAAGIPAKAYERAPALRTAASGNGLVIWHNAVLALRAIGLEKELDAVGTELRRYRFASRPRGKLADWSLTDGARAYGAPAYTVARPALHRMLTELVGDDLRLGARCTGFTETPDGVTARFEDGSAVRGPLLVGADGLRSTVRAQLMPYEPAPHRVGMTACQGSAALPHSAVPPGVFVNTFGEGTWFVYYRTDDDSVYWDAVLCDGPARRLAEGAPHLGSGIREALLREFGHWPSPVPELIGATEDSGILPVDVVDRDPVPRWSTDRVTLVGDAAQPVTFNLGQGANQAIEGAVVLAQCLAKARGGPPAGALAAYGQRRIARTRKIARRSRANAAFSRFRSPLACLLRDTFMRVAFDGPVYRATYRLTMDTDLTPEDIRP